MGYLTGWFVAGWQSEELPECLADERAVSWMWNSLVGYLAVLLSDWWTGEIAECLTNEVTNA